MSEREKATMAHPTRTTTAAGGQVKLLLHAIAHILSANSVRTDHQVHDDGHEYLVTVCITCGERLRLAHSSACTCHYWGDS